MKLDLRITPRDKVMLAVLFAVLLMAGWVNFLLLPLLNQHQKLTDDLSSIEDSLRQMQMTISSGSDLPSQLQKVQEKLASFRAILPEPMSTEQMDRLVTGLMQQYNLKPQTLVVSTAVEKTVEAYKFAPITENEKAIKGVLPTAEVRFSCEGTTRNFFQLLQGLETDHKYIRVLQYHLAEDMNNQPDFNLDRIDTIQGSILIYMFRK